jgi:hypothetical protein
MTELVAGVVYFFSVFAKAFQQRNVAFVNYKLILPTSYLLSVTDVAWIGLTTYQVVEVMDASQPMWRLVTLAVAIGTGGGLGCLASMWIHHRHFTHERFK